jgi:hypothetical protein
MLPRKRYQGARRAPPPEEYGSTSKSEECRAHSIEFINKAIEGLRREREKPTEGRLATIRTYYEPPESIVPSEHWLEDEDIEAIHRALGTPVAIWNTEQSRTRGPLIRPHMHMSAAEAATFLATPRTSIEASPSHYTCFGHTVGKLKALLGHPPMDSGTFREEILHQTACLLVRASRNRKAIQNLRDTQRSKPREARSAARNSQKAAAAPSNQRVTKNTRLNPDAEKTESRTKTRRKGEPARAATPDGLPQRGGEAPEIPSPEGLRQRGKKVRGQGHQRAFPSEGAKPRRDRQIASPIGGEQP